ncbi:MAG: hypothetical protein R3247_11110 [Rhodothermales bacterium]|nr:hypothetical protein [Rhodothermales bacterium]
MLHAALVRTQGYVVGAPLQASGLHRHGGRAAWDHVGWNHPNVRGIAVNPSDPDQILLACGNGVLRSTDGGTTWRIATGWRVTEAQAVAIDPSHPEHAYLATAYGIWRSRDGGASWSPLDDSLAHSFTQAIAVDRRRTGHVLAGTWTGILRSLDGGDSWHPSGPGGVAIYSLAQSTHAPSVWLAGTLEQGLLRSTDGGRTWRRVPGTEGHTFHAVAFDPGGREHAAAGGWSTGVFFSDDAGRTWVRRGHALPAPHLSRLAFDPAVPGRLWAATVEQGVFYTDDAGHTWQRAGLGGALVYDLVFLPVRSP